MSKGANNFNFAGLNGFIWWLGEVENGVDPLGVGRAQVRIFGWYGDTVTTEDLPWAMPMHSINNRYTFQPLKDKFHSSDGKGDWVLGFFMDGEAAQFPIMMGVLPGFNPPQA
jgi:hypothetical protein